MKCPKCQFENPEEARFCNECGNKLELACPECGKVNPLGSKFCNECGQRLEEVVKAETALPEAAGERKHVTVLFSDLSGYTTMSERLDPEEVKEITSRVFAQISQVINKYEGFVEKFVGDAVMALFGVPKLHEDDPVRAIRAAREIHEIVDAISPEVEERIGQSISMHSGINTGLVVTGEVDVEKGAHGVAGDTINVASRLSSLAEAREILVGVNTSRQAEGYFNFEELEPVQVKGKTELVQAYKLLSARDKPITLHRLSGLRADLIGRKVEMAQLGESVEKLRDGKGSIFSICGDAGTGKSRLVGEFKTTLDLDEIQWLEGHAYAYAQNIPYFPLIDLLNGVLQIEEGDPPEKVREKLESGIENLVGKKENIVPYIGSLYVLSYPEVENVSPEFWKARLQDAMRMILSALARRAPTVFCLEDLHWADPSFVELLRNSLLEVRHPAIVLCVYRPLISLFTSHQLNAMSRIYHEIQLQDFSPSEAQDMVESLLKTDTIPYELQQFVQKKVEGNPFYLEEVIKSLIESETLIRDNDTWELIGSITESNISSTIHGVISARLDRLEKETKRILQEASVIGRAFLYEILNRISELKEDIDGCLSDLERLDLIRTRSLHPDLEYIFKHALTQEVVYNGLLKKERKVIHDRIGLVIEQLFQDRLPEFYETLAIHFKQGQSELKAVDYLMKSGEKSLKRYALEESHSYYNEAYEILRNKPDRTNDGEELLIDLLNKWALVYLYRGYFNKLSKLLLNYKQLADSLGDRASVGMFYVWLGMTLLIKEQFKDSYQYFRHALELGERIENWQTIAYACSWLTWTCAELGLLDEGILYGNRALEMSKYFESDHYVYSTSLGGLGQVYWYKGDSRKTLEIGKTLILYGTKHSEVRSLVPGHICKGQSYFTKGDLSSAIKSFQEAAKVSADPYYYQWSLLWLGAMYVMDGQFQEAEEALMKVMVFDKKYDTKDSETWAKGLLGIVFLSKGQMSLGLKMLEEGNRLNIEEGKKSCNAVFEHALGKVFYQIIERSEPINLLTVIKNIGFLAKNIPIASKKAELHFNRAIEVSKEIGAKCIMGQAYLDLGLLHKLKKRPESAKECISKAIKLLEQCEAEGYLQQAREALTSLG